MSGEGSKNSSTSYTAVIKSSSFDGGDRIKVRKLPDDSVEYLDPIWLYDNESGKPYFRCIEKQLWYHGFREKCELKILLKNAGDWLVKIPDPSQSHNLVISVRVTNKVIAKFPLTRSDEKFWFLSAAKRDKKLRYFLNPVDLVDFYTTRTLPGGYTMKNIVQRPCWVIKSSKIVYDNEDDLIDQGTFSSVYNGRYLSPNKKYIDVIVKKYRNAEKYEKIYKDNMDDFIRESKSLSYLIHTNLLSFYGIVLGDSRIRILEPCMGSSLSKHLKKEKDNISISELNLYCYEICRGMEYLHFKNHIHKNLKCKNVYISLNGSLKVGDFEFMCLPHQNFTKISSFMAPELFKNIPNYSFKSDIWAMSVVIYEIFSHGQIPYELEKEETIINNIVSGNLWSMPSKIPKDLKANVVQMQRLVPTDRPTFKYLKHFFTQNISKSKKVFPPSKITLNKLPGVQRSKFYLKNSCREYSERYRSSSSSDSNHLDKN
uniref:Tyrosine-protein kinase n=1 Tax=Strongyloides venezuelensis TaxID=75913 RepID=A0A0K0FBY8_STRVS